MSDLIVPEFKFAIRDDLSDTKELFLPKRATDRATGWDVKAAMKDRAPLELSWGQYAKIPLGIRGLCPDGWWYELKPRSSTFGKKSLHALYGTIDEDYEGELVFACQYLPEPHINTHILIVSSFPSLKIEFGEAIGQIVPVKRAEIKVSLVTNEQLDAEFKARDAARGTGGFGSSDKK